MLNLNEYNESLYKALDKKNRKKNMVENYGKFLMHAKKTSGVTNLPDKTWLTDEVRGAVSEAYKVLNKKSMQVDGSNDPSAIYDACRGEISVLAKLIRKANAGGLDSSYITQLNNYRNELESRAEEARSAMSRENQSSKVARHSEEAGEALEHGEKWRKHKYLRIENGRYIYPEDLKKELGNSGWMNGNNKNVQKKLSALNEKQAIADRVASLNGNTPAAKANANNMFGVTDAKRDLANTMKSQNMMREVVNAEKAARDAQQKANYEKNKAAAEAMSQNNQKNSTVVKNQQQSDYEKNKAAAEAMAQKQQANSTVVKNQQKSNYEKNKAAAENEKTRREMKIANDKIDDIFRDTQKLEGDDIFTGNRMYQKALAEVYGMTVEEATSPGNHNRLLNDVRNSPEKTIKLAKLFEKYYNEEKERLKELRKKIPAKPVKPVTGVSLSPGASHSSFSISDEEMEAFLAHKAN